MNIVGRGSYFYKTRRKYIWSGIAFGGIFSKLCFLPREFYQLSLKQRNKRIKGGSRIKQFRKYIPFIMDRFILEFNLPCSSLLSIFGSSPVGTTKFHGVSLFSSLSLAILASVQLLNRVIFGGAAQLWFSNSYLVSHTSYMKWSFFYVKRQLRLKFYDSLLFTLQNLRSRVAYILMKSKRTNQYLLFSYLNKIIYGKSMGQLVQSKKEKKRKQHNYLHGLDMSLAIARNRTLLPFNNIEIRLNTSLQTYNSLLAGFRKIYKHLWVNYYYFLIGYRRWLDRVYRYLQQQSLSLHRRTRRRYWLHYHKYYKQVIWNKYYKPQILKAVESSATSLDNKNDVFNSLLPLQTQNSVSRMKVLRLLLLRYLKWKKKLSRRRLFNFGKLQSQRFACRYIKTPTGVKRIKVRLSKNKKDIDLISLIKSLGHKSTRPNAGRKNKRVRRFIRKYRFFVSKLGRPVLQNKIKYTRQQVKLKKARLVRYKSRWRIRKKSSILGNVGWLQRWKFFSRGVKPRHVKYFNSLKKRSLKRVKFFKFCKTVKRRLKTWYKRQSPYNKKRVARQVWFKDLYYRGRFTRYGNYPKHLAPILFPYGFGKKDYRRLPKLKRRNVSVLVRRLLRIRKSQFRVLFKHLKLSNPGKKISLRAFMAWYLPRIRSSALAATSVLSKTSSGYFFFQRSWYRFYRELKLHNYEDLRNFLIRSDRKKYLKYRDRKWKNWYYYTQKIKYFGDLLMSVTGIADYTSVSHSGVGWRARRVIY